MMASMKRAEELLEDIDKDIINLKKDRLKAKERIRRLDETDTELAQKEETNRGKTKNKSLELKTATEGKTNIHQEKPKDIFRVKAYATSRIPITWTTQDETRERKQIKEREPKKKISLSEYQKRVTMMKKHYKELKDQQTQEEMIAKRKGAEIVRHKEEVINRQKEEMITKQQEDEIKRQREEILARQEKEQELDRHKNENNNEKGEKEKNNNAANQTTIDLTEDLEGEDMEIDENDPDLNLNDIQFEQTIYDEAIYKNNEELLDLIEQALPSLDGTDNTYGDCADLMTMTLYPAP